MSKLPEHECVICGVHFTGFGHNPDPFETVPPGVLVLGPEPEGRACDDCNFRFVIPARLTKLQPRDRELLKHFARLGAAFSRMRDFPIKGVPTGEAANL